MTAALLLCLSLLAPPPAPLAAAPLAPPDAGDDPYQFVAGLFEKGLHDMVVREAEAFLEEHARHPKAPLARYRLALSLFELGRPEDAAPHLERLAASEGFEYRPEAALRLAQCHLDADDPERATRALETVLAADAGYLEVPATFLLGEARFRAGDFEGAAESYGAALERATSADDAEYAARARLGLAWCAYRGGDHEATLAEARAFLRRHGGEDLAGEARFLEGEALLELGRPGEAVRAFEQVRGAHEDGALRGVGFARAALDEPAASARAFGELLERFPESPWAAEAAFHRGVQLLEAGDAAAARAALADPRVPVDAETLYWRGWAELQDGAHAEAERTLERALGERPDGALAGRIQSLRGDVLRALGREGEALAAYERAGSDYSLYAAAVAAVNAARAAEAERLARSLIERHPDSAYRARAELALGEALFLAERWTEAEEAFSAASGGLEEAADRARCASRLAWCRYLAGDPAAAAERFDDLAREAPATAEGEEALFMAARARLDAGDTASAARGFERYLEAHPRGARRDRALLELARLEEDGGGGRLERLLRDHPQSPLVPEALYELAERLSAAGRHAEAEEHYGRLVRDHADHELATPALYGLAWCAFEGGEHDEAVAALRSFQRSGSAVSEELVLSGLELLVHAECARGRPAEATAAYQRFAGSTDDDGRAFALARTLAEALREAGDADAAAKVLENCLVHLEDPGVMASALVEGVYLSLEQGDVHDAEARARVARRRAPEDPAVAEALFFVAEEHFEAGRDEHAAELYREAAAVPGSPVAASALYKEGFAHLRRGDAAPAARAFESLVGEHAGDPLRGEGLFLAAEARYRLGEREAALVHLAELRRGFPRHEVAPRALFRGGVALCELERWEEARSWLTELTRSFPDFENATEAELWRGRALAATGDHRGARQALERVTARDRGALAARARLELGHLRHAAGDVEGALSEYLKVAVLYAGGDEVAEALWRSGQCLEQLGDPERARLQYAELRDAHPDSPLAARARERLRTLQ